MIVAFEWTRSHSPRRAANQRDVSFARAELRVHHV